MIDLLIKILLIVILIRVGLIAAAMTVLFINAVVQEWRERKKSR